MEAVKRLASITNWSAACGALGVARASVYRFFRHKGQAVPADRTSEAGAISYRR